MQFWHGPGGEIRILWNSITTKHYYKANEEHEDHEEKHYTKLTKNHTHTPEEKNFYLKFNIKFFG